MIIHYSKSKFVIILIIILILNSKSKLIIIASNFYKNDKIIIMGCDFNLKLKMTATNYNFKFLNNKIIIIISLSSYPF